jgi:hypothetical protein
MINADFVFPQVRYPLQIGDTWKFRLYFNSDVTNTPKIIRDTLMPNGKTYKVFQNYFSYRLSFQRHEGNRVFMFEPWLKKDITLFIFDKNVGDTVVTFQSDTTFLPYDTTDITLIDKKTVNIFGQNQTQWVFLVDHYRHVIDDEQTYFITDNFGLTDYEEMWGSFYLSGAIIDSVMYGDYTHVLEESISLPQTLFLAQNYPNPFNPTTTISFCLTKPTIVQLEIYNTLGVKVKTYFEENLQAGEHKIVWDGNDDKGRSVPSGVYYYRFTTDKSARTRKMLLLK